MAVDPLDMQKMTEGKLWCHRTQPMLIPRELQRIDLVRLACIGEQCALWDAANNQCVDVSNADSIAMIASALDNLIKQLDVLCFHAGER